MTILLGILCSYLLGSIITAIILGYIDYDPCFSDKPPAALVVLFWPISLLVFGYLQLYQLGHYLKRARDARIARQLSETPKASPRPSWLGPPK